MTSRVIILPAPPPELDREATCPFCGSTFWCHYRSAPPRGRIYEGECEVCGAAAVLTYVAPEEKGTPRAQGD